MVSETSSASSKYWQEEKRNVIISSLHESFINKPDFVIPRLIEISNVLNEDYIQFTSYSIEKRFDQLSIEWKEQSKYISSISEISELKAYKKIIEMGYSVIPLIFQSLKSEPDFWFMALKTLINKDPVKDEDRGNLDKMAEAWIKLGSSEGYFIDS